MLSAEVAVVELQILGYVYSEARKEGKGERGKKGGGERGGGGGGKGSEHRRKIYSF